MRWTDCTNFYYFSVRSAWMQLWIFFSTLFIGSPAPNSYELASVRCHATQSDEKQMSIEVKKKKKKNEPNHITVLT